MSHSLAKSPRHILAVFNLILDMHALVNCQLSKKVFADHCHMTVSRAQVYNSLKVRYLLNLSSEQCFQLIAGLGPCGIYFTFCLR